VITAETLLEIPLLAPIPEHERNTIASRAADVHLQTDEWLVHEGETPSFFALLSGKVAVTRRAADEDRAIATYNPGDYFGEVPLLLNSPAVAGLRALEPSRVLRLDGSDFRELIISCSRLREQILQTMMERVTKLQQATIATAVPTVSIIGRRNDVACHGVRNFLTGNHVAFNWLEPDDAAATSLLPEGVDRETCPIVLFPDASYLITPSYRDIAERLRLKTAAVPGEIYDVVVVGAGPAGLVAGVYGASEGLRTLLIEREAPGGQAGSSSRIENYLGFPGGLSGDDLSTRASQQAKRFGAEMLNAREVKALELGVDGAPHQVLLDGDERVAAKAVVLATGVSWRKLNADGIADFAGRGVYYGAGRSEALETRGKDIYLIGGGNSAGQAAMFFANYAQNVTLLVRGESLTKSMSQYLIDQLATKANVHVEVESEVVAARGTEHLENIVVENRRTKQRSTRETDALFILIGADAETEMLPREIIRDALGYVCTGRDVLDLENEAHHYWPLKRDPYLLETSVPGIFAAGDVRHGSLKRVASSVGEGSMSIAFIHQYLDETAALAAARLNGSRTVTPS
jgi:thioredoxin reductase (NADPH)